MNNIGKALIQGASGGSVVLITAAASPNIESLRMTHNGEVTRGMDPSGTINRMTSHGEFLECEFTFTPIGDTKAEAITNAKLPPLLSGVDIEGLPIIAVGDTSGDGFTDALNSAGAGATNTQPWIYEGGGSLDLSAPGAVWQMTVTLRRYKGITSATAIN